MRDAGLEEAQTGIKIAGRNIINLRYADDTTLMAEGERVIALESWEGNLASRRVEEGLSRSFSG